MPLDQRGKCRLGRLSPFSKEIEQPAVGHRAQRPQVKEHADLLAECGRHIPA